MFDLDCDQNNRNINITCPCVATVPFSNRCPCLCMSFGISAIFDLIQFPAQSCPMSTTTSHTYCARCVFDSPFDQKCSRRDVLEGYTIRILCHAIWIDDTDFGHICRRYFHESGNVMEPGRANICAPWWHVLLWYIRGEYVSSELRCWLSRDPWQVVGIIAYLPQHLLQWAPSAEQRLLCLNSALNLF